MPRPLEGMRSSKHTVKAPLTVCLSTQHLGRAQRKIKTLAQALKYLETHFASDGVVAA